MHQETSASEKLQRERDDELKELLKQSNHQKQTQLEAQQQQMKIARRRLEMKAEDMELRKKDMEIKIMIQDPNSISDPRRRAYIIQEQARITQKIYEEQLQQSGTSNSTNVFGTIFDNIGGSGSDFPSY